MLRLHLGQHVSLDSRGSHGGGPRTYKSASTLWTERESSEIHRSFAFIRNTTVCVQIEPRIRC